MMGTSQPGLVGAKALLGWCKTAPVGTLIGASQIAEILEAGEVEELVENVVQNGPEPWTWRERLWVCPAETRLGVVELVEALGVSKAWVYARTQQKAEAPIPHAKLDGTLTFKAGELRAWIRDREEVVIGGRMDSTEWEKRGLKLMGGEDDGEDL